MSWNCPVFDSAGLIKDARVGEGVRAFPGAEGAGRNAVGGRGGTVIKVTNLNDSGSGSYRDAVTAAGARIVVFDVSGIINLDSAISISNDNITIAGQTSPGGICIAGYTVTTKCSEVIMRHMRHRCGNHKIASGADPETLDAFDMWGPSGHYDDASSNFYTNLIIDHCSFSWGVDECVSTSYDLEKVTFSWNIVAEGLSNAGHPKGEHSKGLFFWAQQSPRLEVSCHHNFIANNHSRNPLINTGIAGYEPTMDIINNVTYNAFGGYHAGSTNANVHLNWKHNFVKAGPESNANFYEIFHQNSATPVEVIYVIGNMGQNRTTQVGSEWLVASSWAFTLQSEAWRTMTPWPMTTEMDATTMSPTYAQAVVDGCGATKPFRDSADDSVVADYAAGTGGYKDDTVYPDDFPTYTTPSPPTDTSGDGIPDTWATDHGLNPAIDNSADTAPSGYTWIEEYINELADA